MPTLLRMGRTIPETRPFLNEATAIVSPKITTAAYYSLTPKEPEKRKQTHGVQGAERKLRFRGLAATPSETSNLGGIDATLRHHIGNTPPNTHTFVTPVRGDVLPRVNEGKKASVSFEVTITPRFSLAHSCGRPSTRRRHTRRRRHVCVLRTNTANLGAYGGTRTVRPHVSY